MPFKSQAQRRYLFARHPSVAKKFARHTPKGKKLPERVSERSVENGEYASTQLQITDSSAIEKIRAVQSRLDPDDVIELEEKPHITVKYGLLESVTQEDVAKRVAKTGPVWVRLGDLSLFQNDEADVLKLSVESLGLENLNRLVGLLPNKDSHRVYSPHMTIAYLKSGTGHKYLSDPTMLKWESFVFTDLVFSSKDRLKTEIALNCGGPGSGKPGPCPSRVNEYLGKNGTQVHPTWTVHPDPAQQATGGVIFRSHKGKTQVLLRSPTGEYDGYVWTFPKGKRADQFKTHPDAVTTALAEVAEETGHKGIVLGPIPGVFSSGSGLTNTFFAMHSGGKSKKLMDKETRATAWVDIDKAHKYINKTWNPEGRIRDLAILGAARHYVRQNFHGPTVNTAINPLLYDPSRTASLRKAFEADVTRRFKRLKQEIIKLVVEDDAFGLKQPKTVSPFTTNVFCPTGEGGGVDPSCSPKKSLSSRLKGLKSEFAKVAQEEYDAWEQDADGIDEICGGGGICDLVSRRIQEVVAAEIPDAEIFDGGAEGDDHAWTVVKVGDKAYGVDIAPGVYETGGGYSWKKIPGVAITSEDVDVFEMEADLFDTQNQLTGNSHWQALSSSQKVQEFLFWLKTKLAKIIDDPNTPLDDWWAKYVEQGFKKGQGRVFDDVKKKGIAQWSGKEGTFFQGAKDQFLKSAFNNPVSVDKVKLLVGRVGTELQGVTDAMLQNITRTLADGLVQGKSPREIGRDIADDVDDIGVKRGTLIARTEIVRSHADGQLVALKELGADKVQAMVEWRITGDARVCELCRPLNGVVMTIDAAEGLIPRHPNCRCAWLPANIGENPSKQIRGQQMLKAIKKSIIATKPRKGKKYWG